MIKHKLNNGLEVFIDKDVSSEIVTFCYLVKCGSFNENDSNRGIAHFTEHMLFKGTTNRKFSEINKDIEKVGGMLNAETSFDYTRYYSVVPLSQWEIGINVISDIIWNNTIPHEEFDKEKNVVIEELLMYDDDPQDKAIQNLNILLTGDYENRKLIGGTPESVSNITREDMINFIDKFYTPNNMALVITGNVDENKILDFINSYINIDITLNKKEEVERINIEKIKPGENVEKYNNIGQAHIAFGLNGPEPSSDDYTAFEIIAHVLGGNSSSILYHTIREVEGLAYITYVHTEELFDCSQLIGYVGLNKSNIKKCKNIILKEFKNIYDNGLSEEILKQTIDCLKGNSILGLETCRSKNSYLCNCIIYGMDYDKEEYFKKLDQVNINTIKTVAKKYLQPEKISFSYVTP